MKQLFIGAVALLFATFAALADPTGTYDVKGVYPDGEAYAGELEIAKVGDVFELNFTFTDSTQQQGSAVGDDTFLAYGYSGDGELGVGLMNAKGTNWEGIWTNVGASKLGTEVWTKK